MCTVNVMFCSINVTLGGGKSTPPLRLVKCVFVDPAHPSTHICMSFFWASSVSAGWLRECIFSPDRDMKRLLHLSQLETQNVKF